MDSSGNKNNPIETKVNRNIDILAFENQRISKVPNEKWMYFSQTSFDLFSLATFRKWRNERKNGRKKIDSFCSYLISVCGHSFDRKFKVFVRPRSYSFARVVKSSRIFALPQVWTNFWTAKRRQSFSIWFVIDNTSSETEIRSFRLSFDFFAKVEKKKTESLCFDRIISASVVWATCFPMQLFSMFSSSLPSSSSPVWKQTNC